MVPIALLIAALSSNTHSITLGGDVMLNGISPKQKPFEKIAPLLSPAGTAILNLEIPLTSSRKPTRRKTAAELKARTQYILKADPRLAPHLRSTGVDLVSLGNNHAMDYGLEGLQETQQLLTAQQILFAGAGEHQQAAEGIAIYKNSLGKRIGLFSALAFVSAGGLGKCTPASATGPGVATFSFGGLIDKKARTRLSKIFLQAKKECDILVVGLHWGIEKQTLPTPYQVALGRACVDEGADIVWGNHPHVLQGAEIYKGKPILYSMGNFVSPRPGSTGLVKLIYNGDDFRKALFFPAKIANGQVTPQFGPAGQERVKAFAGLCRNLAARYPHKESKPMFGG